MSQGRPLWPEWLQYCPGYPKIRHRACALRRGRMPRAVWQGFCNLLRAPPPPGGRPLPASPILPGLPGRPWRLPGALQGFHDGPGSPPRPPRGPKMPPRRAKMASRRPKRPPRRPKRPPRALPRGPQEAKIIDFPMVFERFWHSRRFGFPTLQDDPRGLQDRPKTAQEASKRAPRLPKRTPRRRQRRP